MLADKPTSFKPLFRHSMEMNVIKKGVLEVYGLKVIGEKGSKDDQPECNKKIEKSEKIEPRRRTGRSGSVAVSSFFPGNSDSNRLEGSQNRTFSKQQQKYLEEFNKKPGQKVFVTVYRTCTEYFAVIYPLKMILSARLPINCINLRTSKLEKLENNLIKLFFGLRNGEYAYSIVFKIVDSDSQASNQNKNLNNFKKNTKSKKKNESYSVSSDDESNDGQSNNEFKEAHKNYLSSDDDHESIEETNEDNIVTFNFNDHDQSNQFNSKEDFFVSWFDALSGKIDINADGELVNNSKTNCNKPTGLLARNNLLQNNNGKTTTNSNLLTVRTDDHRRRLSLQTIPETDGDI